MFLYNLVLLFLQICFFSFKVSNLYRYGLGFQLLFCHICIQCVCDQLMFFVCHVLWEWFWLFSLKRLFLGGGHSFGCIHILQCLPYRCQFIHRELV